MIWAAGPLIRLVGQLKPDALMYPIGIDFELIALIFRIIRARLYTKLMGFSELFQRKDVK